MKYKILVLIILSLAFCLLGDEAVALTAGADPDPATTTVKDGYALLNSLLTLFDNLPVVKVKKDSEGDHKMSPGLAEVENRLTMLVEDSKAAFEANVIDKIFFNRYRRMLTIFKMIITPVIKNELLGNPFMKAFEEFVWNTTYERWNWDDKDSIAKMAAAMEEEFVQMQFYLDTRQAREEFKKKIGKRILPPPPPPASAKKKPEVK
jgi:hypothetical protein